MKTRSNSKRALLCSALSIALCLSMLIGTTFAWFTDTATANVSKITSGTLGVEIQNEQGNEITALEWVAKNGRAQDEILWEPGCTYTLTPFKIVNTGNLALKYKMVITGLEGDAELLDVIKFTYKLGDATLDLTEEGHLTAKGTDGASSKLITISATMDKNAGNQYQGKTLDGVSIKVYATQDTVEFDSTTDQYDKDATYYPVIDAAGLKDALTNGGNVKLEEDVAVLPENVPTEVQTLVALNTVNKDTILDLSGKKIGIDKSSMSNDYGKASLLLMAVTDGTLTINGNGEINCEAGNNQTYGINVNGGSVVINDGNYYGAMTAIQVQKGSLEINGGFFDMAPTCKAAVPQYAKYVVNCIDSAYKDNTATISIKGGTFVNFDPSANPEGAGTTYVANGYSVISEAQANGDVWYTVVKGDVTTLTPDTVNKQGIYHSNGTYFLSAGNYDEFTATLEQSYKNVTFLASENAKFDEVTICYHGGTPSDATISAKGDSTLTVMGFHVNGNISIYSFDKNVIVEENDAASITLKTNHVVDMDVRFLNNKLGAGTASNGYGIYFVPNTTNYDLTITGNTFTGTKSHAIAVQGCGDGTAVTAAKSIIVENNTFNSYGLNGKDGRAAFKIWADSKLAPNGNDDVNKDAKALADSVKTKNTFSGSIAGNCVVADFYGRTVAFN